MISIACLLHFQPMHNISTGICWQGTMPSRSRSPRGNPLVGHGVGNDIPMDAQLGQFLKKQFLLNKLPANTIQEIALLAQQGGAHHMTGLSKFGQQWECTQEHFQRLDEGKYAQCLCSKTIYGDYSHHFAQNKSCCIGRTSSSSSI